MAGREFRVFGPPGTGKTTFLVGEIRRLVLREGPDAIAIASFTRVGAKEIADRVELELASYGFKLRRENTGTVHSLALRTFDVRPPIAEVDDLAKEWNKWHAHEGAKWILDNVGGGEELLTSVKGAGEFMASYGRARNMILDPPFSIDACSSNEFDRWREAWEEFKKENDAVDFTDMIEQAGSLDPAVRYLIVDEAQDLTPLEARLVRRWGEELELLVMAGDDDQAIFEFRGGTANVMLSPPVSPEMVKVLSRSYRLPKVIKDYTEKLIVDRVTRRQVKEFEPNADGGMVEPSTLSLNDPKTIVDRIEEELARFPEGTVMVLASCGKMVGYYTAELRKRGLLFHNPYQVTRGDWNIHRNKVLVRLKSFLKGLPNYNETPRWTLADVGHFCECFAWKGLPNSIPKKDIIADSKSKEMRATIVTVGDVALMLGVEDADFSPEFFFEHLLKSFQQASGFAKEAMKRYGPNILNEEPRVIPGTIHSVKGAQADTVILFPDISRMASKRTSEEDMEAKVRVFYVGMTRAKQQLILAQPSSKLYFHFPEPEKHGEQPSLLEPVPF